MNISGVLVATSPRNIEQLSGELVRLPGVEVHGANDLGKLVVTVETEHEGQMADTVVAIQNLRGVLSAAMIYHHNEAIDCPEQEEQ